MSETAGESPVALVAQPSKPITLETPAQPPKPIAPETSKHTPAVASKNWLKRGFNKLERWGGHAALTTGAEVLTQMGAVTAQLGMAGSILTGNPLVYVASLAPSAMGAAIGWQGVKHGGFMERMSYLATKAAMPASALAGPTGSMVMAGISAGSTALGMRHRK